MKQLKKIAKFSSETAEANFWQEHDSTDYIDWSKAKLAKFPHLKPSTKSISLRLPEGLLDDIKVLANKEDIPYQSLIKFLLTLGVNQLYRRKAQHHS